MWSLRERNGWRKSGLLLASYIFYGWWDWRFCFLLLSASLVAWLAGVWMEKVDDAQNRKSVMFIAIALLLLVLAFFKYYGFFLTSLQDLLYAFGWQRDLPFLQIILPVGISFFTFQAISYVADVYRGSVRARRRPLDVLLYISFFPQLVAGPIIRAGDFLPQLDADARLDRNAVVGGLVLSISGLFKKMVVANYLAVDLVDPVFLDPDSYSSLMVLLAIYGYAIQIYCDFSGYSDIAIGTAAMLGFHFKANFNQPYRATSLRDFWRRWHISLSQWLRDYLYIPLGGSRLGSLRSCANLFITMFLGGLWHGAAWNFLIWGSLHGIWLGLEYICSSQNSNSGWARLVFGWLVTFHLVCIGWIFFRASDFSAAIDMVNTLMACSANVEGLTWFTLVLIGATMSFQFWPPGYNLRLVQVIERRSIPVIGALFTLSLIVILWLSPPGTAPFIYFQF